MMNILRENDNGRDNVYVNVNLNYIENKPADYFGAQEANFIENNTVPILKKADDYYCSVIRFDIPLNGIPIMIMPILPPPNIDINLSPLIIGVSYSGNNYPTNLIYTSEHGDIPQPVNTSTPNSIYYWIYAYNHLIKIINTALETSWTNAGLTAFPVPYFIYEAESGLISLIVPKICTDLVNNPIIFMNVSLLKYLDGFWTFTRGDNSLQGRDYDFVTNIKSFPYYPNGPIVRTGPAVPPVVGTTVSTYDPPQYYKYQQEYPMVAYWSNLRKIFITTNTIPIAYESTISNDTQVVQYPILTDFVPIIEKTGQSRSISYYVPPSQYRLVDLISSSHLQKLDLKFFWETTDGIAFPLLLLPRQQLNVKLGFFRKSLYKQMNLLLK